MSANLKAGLLNHRRRKEVDLDGLKVWVREFSANELKEYGRAWKDIPEAGDDAAELNLVANTAIKIVCDENGSLVFTSDDIEAVKGMGMGTLRTLTEAAAKLSIPSQDKNEKKD